MQKSAIQLNSDDTILPHARQIQLVVQNRRLRKTEDYLDLRFFGKTEVYVIQHERSKL